jgi:hypothetical protein
MEAIIFGQEHLVLVVVEWLGLMLCIRNLSRSNQIVDSTLK